MPWDWSEARDSAGICLSVITRQSAGGRFRGTTPRWENFSLSVRITLFSACSAMSALLAEYPGARPVYVYAAEIQAAFEAWESAWGLYCQGGDYQNALYAAQQADNPAAILQVLQCAMPNFVAEYPNEFACMQAYPVSFLAAADMKQLADEPIRMADGSSHFKDEAGQDALDYIYMTQDIFSNGIVRLYHNFR